MKRLSIRGGGLIACAAIVLTAEPAMAATCSVTPQGVSFGSYDPLSASALDGVGNINVACDVAVSFTVSLSAGSGTFAERRMPSATSHLAYNLYTDASRSTVWGDGISASTVSGSGSNVDLSVYGRINALQNVPAESYSDTIAVTVSY